MIGEIIRISFTFVVDEYASWGVTFIRLYIYQLFFPSVFYVIDIAAKKSSVIFLFAKFMKIAYNTTILFKLYKLKVKVKISHLA